MKNPTTESVEMDMRYLREARQRISSTHDYWYGVSSMKKYTRRLDVALKKIDEALSILESIDKEYWK